MRLRALTLTNVRRFAGHRASITGIGDGVTVISEANEFGKSTFFDAIHALFFEKYGSSARPVKSLQPYAGGAVEVSAEIDTAEGRFRVEKRFMTRKGARILRLPGEQLVAQDDEAERWITGLLGASGEGPAGLLWVRQGLVGLDPDDRKEKATLIETRRDLMSSVAGEIDTMTGGRRMDRVMRRVREDLAQITTEKTGRPSGPWKAVKDEIEVLEAELADLEAKVARLDQALLQRREAEGELLRLNDPEMRLRREAALAEARQALAVASDHQAQLAAAHQQVDIAALRHDNARAALDRFLAAQEALRLALIAADEAEQLRLRLATEVGELAEALRQAQARHEADAQAFAAARARVLAVRKAEAAALARTEAQRLAEVIERASAELARRDAALAEVEASAAKPDWLRKVDQAAAALQRLDLERQAQATSVRLDYDGAARVSLDGQPLPGGAAVVLPATAALDLPGIGRMTVLSGGADSARALEVRRAQAQQALEALLSVCGCKTVDEAHLVAAARADAVRRADLAEAVARSLAPDGLEALRKAKALADLAADQDDPGDLPPAAQCEAALAAAEATAQASAKALKLAEAAHAAARDPAIRAAEKAQAARAARDSAALAAGPEAARESHRSALLRDAAQTAEDLRLATLARDALLAAAPDMATLEAAEARAAAALEATATRARQVSDRLIAVSAEIRALAGQGIEERRDDLAGRLDEARLREARHARNAAALLRLRDALEAERSAARDAYFGPVRDELRPLLAILHGSADLAFDSASLLPSGLTRGAQQEQMEDLSGGTREQIAILTRLAFARLFARKGRHIPIILDDALVYSDDDRIVKMFTALTRAAQDQQILVFSCRQMAFQELGGARPVVSVAPV